MTKSNGRGRRRWASGVAAGLLTLFTGPAGAATDDPQAPEVIEGLRLWSSAEDVGVWLMSKPGIASTRMNPQDAKGRASMQVNPVDRANTPRIAGVRAQLWPVFVAGKLRGLRVLMQAETETGATFCTLDGQGAAQQLNAYLAERFGPEQDGAYSRGGLRARLHYRTYSGPFQSITEICDSRDQGPGGAQIELYLIAEGEEGFSPDQPAVISVRRSATGGLVPVPTSTTP